MKNSNTMEGDGKLNTTCGACKGTGRVKYKKIEHCMYNWQPWLERDCDYCKSYIKK